MPTLADLVYIPAGTPFSNICSVTVFFTNLAYYLIFSSLMVFVVYRLGKAIYEISKGDSAETMENLKTHATDIIFSIVGLLALSSALFFPKTILETMGVPNDKNPFVDFSGCGVAPGVGGAAGGVVIPVSPGAGPVAAASLPYATEAEVASWALGGASSVASAPIAVAGPSEVLASSEATRREEIVIANRNACILEGKKYIDPTALVFNAIPTTSSWKCCEGSCPATAEVRSAMIRNASLANTTASFACIEGYTVDGWDCRRIGNENCDWYSPITGKSSKLLPPLPGCKYSNTPTVPTCNPIPVTNPPATYDLKIMSYNVHEGDYIAAQTIALANYIKNNKIDVIMIQEALFPVEGKSPSRNIHEALEFKKAMADVGYPMYMDYVKYPKDIDGRSVVVLSKYPITETASTVIVGERPVQMVKVESPNGPIRFFNMHLQTNDKQCPGFAQARDFMNSYPGVNVFGGDMNTNLNARCDWEGTQEDFYMSCTDEAQDKNDECDGTLNGMLADFVGLSRNAEGLMNSSYTVQPNISDHLGVMTTNHLVQKCEYK